jgi:Protein of unknown function (DUF2931)
MNHLRRCLWLIVGLGLSACATGRGLPYDTWRLGFFAPPNMEVWVETADVEDEEGRFFPHAAGGTVSIGYHGDPDGWPEHVTFGAGRNVTGAALPRRIDVRWQSLVEPQTYRVRFDIPASIRQLMRQQVYQSAFPDDRSQRSYREYLVIGLAPGGIARMWLKGPGLVALPVLCAQAEVEPLGPDLGLYEGRYVTPNVRTQTYLKSHSVPYDSWRCDQPPAIVPLTGGETR